MKCPYNGFNECIVEQCPSCNYEVGEKTTIEGAYPMYLSPDNAIKQGYAWESKEKTYKFISCKLVDNNVQPVPPKKEIINKVESSNTNVVVVKRGLF